MLKSVLGAGIGIVVLVLAFTNRDKIAEYANPESAKQKQVEQEEAKRRNEKGALVNTHDFLFGEGSWQRRLEDDAARVKEREEANNAKQKTNAETQPTPLDQFGQWAGAAGENLLGILNPPAPQKDQQANEPENKQPARARAVAAMPSKTRGRRFG